MADIDKLQIQIEATASKAASVLDSVVSALKRLSKVTGQTGLDKVSKQLNGLKNVPSMGKMEKELAKLEKQAARDGDAMVELQRHLDDLQQYRGIGNPLTNAAVEDEVRATEAEIEKLAASVDQADAAIRQIKSDMSVAAAEGEKLGESAKKWTPGRSLWSDIGDGAKNAVAAVSQQMGKIRDVIANAFRSIPDSVKYLGNTLTAPIKAAVSAAGKVLAGLGKAAGTAAKATGAALKSVGGYVASKFTAPFKNAVGVVARLKDALGKVLLFRALRSAIKAVTDGLKEGINNLYQWSKAAGTSFAPAMDKIATSMQYMKNSVGAMAAPLIQAVAPAVDFLIDKFAALTSAIGKAMAVLTGKSTYTRAVKFPTEYAEAANEASDAAKNWTMGIDELNIMSDQSEGNTSSGTDYSSMFEEVEIPEETTDWAAQIRESTENSDWGGAGSLLAEKLNGVVASIDTFSIGEKLTGWSPDFRWAFVGL